jgi:hypothetical protein
MNTLRMLLIAAAVIIAAIVAWKIVTILFGIVTFVLTIAFFLAVLYVAFRIGRSALRRPTTP